MRFVIVTGMSGAGKSTKLNRLEPADLADFQICGDGVHTGK